MLKSDLEIHALAWLGTVVYISNNYENSELKFGLMVLCRGMAQSYHDLADSKNPVTGDLLP